MISNVFPSRNGWSVVIRWVENDPPIDGYIYPPFALNDIIIWSNRLSKAKHKFRLATTTTTESVLILSSCLCPTTHMPMAAPSRSLPSALCVLACRNGMTILDARQEAISKPLVGFMNGNKLQNKSVIFSGLNNFSSVYPFFSHRIRVPKFIALAHWIRSKLKKRSFIHSIAQPLTRNTISFRAHPNQTYSRNEMKPRARGHYSVSIKHENLFKCQRKS